MSPEDIQPVNNRLLIEVLNETQEYDGSIQLMDTAKEKSNIGLIKSLPLGYTRHASKEGIEGAFNEGDKVLFNRHSGTVLILDRFARDAPEYRLIQETDILAKINVVLS